MKPSAPPPWAPQCHLLFYTFDTAFFTPIPTPPAADAAISRELFPNKKAQVTSTPAGASDVNNCQNKDIVASQTKRLTTNLANHRTSDMATSEVRQ